MGLIKQILGLEKREEPLNRFNGDLVLSALLGGETITRDKALTLPAVSGAVDFIGNTLASMPVKLYKVTNNKVDEVKEDRRVSLLNGDTNDTLDAFQMKKAMVEDYLLGKGGYCFIKRRRNDVTGLYYVEDKYITIMKNADPINKKFTINVNGKNYKSYEFVKLLRNSKDGASGRGLTLEVSKVLETAYQSILYQLGLMQSGGGKKGFLKSQRRLGESEISQLKQAWEKMYEKDKERVVILNDGLEFQEASNSSVEMQLNESKQTLDTQINNLFHITNDFYLTFKEAVYPIVKAFETALNRDLLLEREKSEYYFEFDTNEVLKTTVAERYNSYKIAKESGWMTLNEIRKMENMNYIDGLDTINVGLGAVLYDIETRKYYVPNTGQTIDFRKQGETPATGKTIDKLYSKEVEIEEIKPQEPTVEEKEPQKQPQIPMKGG